MSTTPVHHSDSDLKRRRQVVQLESSMTECATLHEQESTQTEEIPQNIGRFIPHRKAGSGGFGVVYAAYDPLLHREVAVKVPRSTFLANDKLIERFLREVQAAGSLDHPNILSIVDAGRDGNVPYLVSPLCHGPDLARWLAEKKSDPVPVMVAAHWIEQLADAVNQAHRRGFIHRDIKPSNILLETGGQDNPACWIPKLTDFGLAKALNDDSLEPLTRTGDTLGTPEYMAPEQIAGDGGDVGIATDIHGLGVVLHELLFGKSPFAGTNRAAMMLRILNAPPSYQLNKLAEIPADLRAILDKCLEKKPEDRYATAGDLAEDLHRFRHGLPTRVRPLSWFQLGWRLSRKYPLIAVLSGVLLLLVISFIVSIFRYESSLRESLAEAKSAKKSAEERADLLANRIRVSELNHAFELLAEGKQSLALESLNVLDNYEPDFAQEILRQLIWDRPYVMINSNSDLVTGLHITGDREHVLATLGLNQIKCWNVNTGVESAFFSRLGTVASAPNIQPNGLICFVINGNEFGIIDSQKDFQQIRRFPVPAEFSLKNHGGLYSHTRNDSLFVITDSIHGIFVKHPAQEQVIHMPMKWKTEGFYTPWISPDGRWLVVQVENRKLNYWSLPDGTCHGELPVDSSSTPVIITYSPDGEHCYIGCYDGSVYLIHLARKEIVKHARNLLHDMHLYNTREKNFKPVWADEQKMKWYVGRLNGEVSMVDLATFTETSLVRHRSELNMVADAGMGRLLFADQFELKLFDCESSKVIRSWEIPEELGAKKGTDFLRHVAFLPEQQLLALSNQNGNIALWKLQAPSVRELFHARSGAFAVAFSPDGNVLASAGDDWCVQLWDVKTQKLIRKFKGHINLVEAIAFSADGKWLVSGSYDKKVKLWSVETGECLKTYQGAPSAIRAVAFSHDNKQIIAGCRYFSKTEGYAPIIFWNRENTEPVRTLKAHESAVRSLLLMPDGMTLLSGSEDRTIKVWDISDGDLLKQVNASQQVWQMRIYNDLLVTSGSERFVSVWDLKNWNVIRQFYDPDTHHRGLGISKDGRTIVTGGENGSIRFWQTSTGLHLGKLRLGNDGVVHLTISPDGKYLAAACKSGKIRLYSTK